MTLSSETAKQFVSEFARGWSDPTFDTFVPYFCERFDPEARLIQPLVPDGIGHAALREQFRRLFILIPDLRGTVRRWAGRDEAIFIQLDLTGTLGRKPIAWTVCDVVILRDGRAIERRSFFDPQPLVRATLRRPSAWPRLIRSALPWTRPKARREPGGAGGCEPERGISSRERRAR